MKKISFTLLVVTALALVFIIFTNVNEKKPYDIASVLEDTWDEFGLVSYQIGETAPSIWIRMDETESEMEHRKYLEQNLSQDDLNHYNIEINQVNKQQMEQEHQERLKQLQSKES